jgi:hypothetical protein
LGYLVAFSSDDRAAILIQNFCSVAALGWLQLTSYVSATSLNVVFIYTRMAAVAQAAYQKFFQRRMTKAVHACVQ